ncbi:MAG: peptidoglycan editing factor PgeF [Cycloclasticus sp.]|nr:peptidoglycan editing factor PgeF [Cycloclasticus sp.]MBQ0789012.1 peptidoglycan editing factor PgeF [Cycloclasticus sp.]
MDLISPSWPAPECVKALTTCRQGGFSQAPYASLNLALHVDDDPTTVAKNRARVSRRCSLPSEPIWLEQVHGVKVVDLDRIDKSSTLQADGSLSRQANTVCAVMTADCLPILLCKSDGSAVAAIHAGWRGLLSGVVENAIASLGEAEKILAWLGPAIGPGRFEVGEEVRRAFHLKSNVMAQAFKASENSKYLADLYALVRITLIQQGVKRIYGGDYCTYNQPDKFYSYRREPITGRMASFIWLQP